MTLIGFATYGDHAEFITDTVSYSRRAETMGRCTKHLTLNHIDASVLTGGDSDFGDQAKYGAKVMSSLVATFDELVETAPEWLQHSWTGGEQVTESVVFLIGWSDRAGAFTAHAFASERDFKPLAVSRPWVMPTPWTLRPSGLELRRLKVEKHDHPQIEEAAAHWSSRPPLVAPQSIEEWVDLAKLAREQRSLGGNMFAKVFVAGELFHTRLGRGEVHTQRVHQFNDAGDELLQMVAGTAHPLALASECGCDSGKPFGECCGVDAPAPAGV